MVLFAKKSCADFLKEIRRLIKVIAGIPEQPPSLRAKEEIMAATQAMAKRALKQIKKVYDLDPKAVNALEGILYLIEGAKDYGLIKPCVLQAAFFLEDLEKACQQKLARQETAARPRLKRGPPATYGRMMTAAEYKRLVLTKHIESAELGELVPAFQAPKSIIDYFMKIEKKAVHNLYALIGGTGHVDYIVFFQTDVVPTLVGSPRRWPNIMEIKFPSDTPATIVQIRRV